MLSRSNLEPETKNRSISFPLTKRLSGPALRHAITPPGYILNITHIHTPEKTVSLLPSIALDDLPQRIAIEPNQPHFRGQRDAEAVMNALSHLGGEGYYLPGRGPAVIDQDQGVAR